MCTWDIFFRTMRVYRRLLKNAGKKADTLQSENTDRLPDLVLCLHSSQHLWHTTGDQTSLLNQCISLPKASMWYL